MNPLARAIIRGSGAGFTYASVPSQLLRVNGLEGSFGFSGSVLTSVTDLALGGTVTVSGSPTYTAADAALNGAPSFTPAAGALVVAPNVNRASLAYVAVVAYASGNSYLYDGTVFTGRQCAYLSTGGGGQLSTRDEHILIAGAGAAGRKRALIPMDGATAVMLDGTSYGTLLANTGTGNGLTLGCSYAALNPVRLAFFMACSAVPDSTTRAALEAKLLADFG